MKVIYTCSPNNNFTGQIGAKFATVVVRDAVGVMFDIIGRINRHTVSQSLTMQYNMTSHNCGSKSMFSVWSIIGIVYSSLDF